MVHAFLLLVYLGTGETRSLVSGDMYFYSIVDCNFYAAQVSKRYGNYRSIESINQKTGSLRIVYQRTSIQKRLGFTTNDTSTDTSDS